MMTAVPSPFPTAENGQRLWPRHMIGVALDVITLRSGIPESIPGRCTDISESGLGAAIAGELSVNQHVGIELKLPTVAFPLRARAIVRHSSRLRCGLQFVALPAEQSEMIRFWLYQNIPAIEARPPAPRLLTHMDPEPQATNSDSAGLQKNEKHRPGGRLALVTAMAVVLATGAWWYWQSAWGELEGSNSASAAAPSTAPIQVSWDIVQRQITYRSEPVYSELARKEKTEGTVIVDAVISPDGAVKKVRPVAGPDVLVDSALDAVRSWKFEPFVKDGHTVAVETAVAVDFRLK